MSLTSMELRFGPFAQVTFSASDETGVRMGQAAFGDHITSNVTDRRKKRPMVCARQERGCLCWLASLGRVTLH